MKDVEISLRPDGPYLVRGPVSIVDAAGNEFPVERDVVALCRCGGSKTKPFCDGTHHRIGFRSDEPVLQQAAEHS